MSEFQDKVVLVTGAAGALGRAVVAHFADQGGRIAQLDVIELDNDHYSATCDLTDPAACEAAVAAIRGELGPIQVLANIAGGFDMGPAVHETSAETWDFLMGLNAHSVLNMARAVVPGMLESGAGKIINIGAGAGQRGTGNMGAYSASKSVVIRLTEAMSDELRESGINVNCILPSIIDTERNRADMPDADYSKWVNPTDMAAVIGFLASRASDPVHGAALPVTGLS
jgi:NAD(P)-dependent dehydrogenase (short-subunit alcohol dehydrogenase family)